jgi:hypothetical protein
MARTDCENRVSAGECRAVQNVNRRKDLIDLRGVDHRAFDNHVAVNVWAGATLGPATSVSLKRRLWRCRPVGFAKVP